MLPTYEHTTSVQKSQDVVEKASTKKAESRIMAKLLYKADAKDTARKMATCGDMLIFREYEDGTHDVAAAIYCKQRLCPNCQWRRSRKAAGQLSRVMNTLDAERLKSSGKKYAWIALSYSPRNVLDIADVGDQIDRLTASFGRLMRMAKTAAAVRGASRCVEIRRSSGEYDPRWRGSWQVHVHAILCVDPSYFHSRNYISRDEWGPMIARALDITYIPQFYIERVDRNRRRKEGSAAETVKYITKLEIPFDPNSDVDLYALHMLNIEMFGRHFIQHYGVVRQKFRELYGSNSSDNDSADLHDIEPTRSDLAYVLIAMHWTAGFGYQPIQLNPKRDALLISQLDEAAADSSTGELITPQEINRGKQIDFYARTEQRGEYDLREYQLDEGENPFLP